MNFKTGLLGFVIGGITGAIIALLYAPQSGEETRHILVDNSQQLKEDAVDSIRKAQNAAIEKVNEAQKRLDAINQESRELLSQLKSIGESTLKAEKEATKEGRDNIINASAA